MVEQVPEKEEEKEAKAPAVQGDETDAQAKVESKPAEAPKPEPAAKPQAVSRRGFLSWMVVAWVAFSGAVSASLVAFGRFMFPNVLFEPPMTFKAGYTDDYILGQVDTRWKEAFGVWIVRSEEGTYALSTICTHLGCTPNWLEAENKFKCPCHGSGFTKFGINFEGPAPRPLERFRIVLADDGQILVDKSRMFLFEKGQWSDPESLLKA